MKVSVVVTVFNETRTIIRGLIDSLLRQTKKPDEIIIVNAGKTVVKKSSMVRIIELKGANRSQGRNAGIKAAKNQIVAVTDAGCAADKDWLKRLVEPLRDKKVQSAAGFYRPVCRTQLQAAMAPFLAVLPNRFNPKTYLPSSRSLAFRKGAAWYPENLNYCEDLIFARRLEAAGKMARVKEAVVYWEMPATLGEFFTRVKNYAAGDVAARYWPHLLKIATVWLRYVAMAAFPPLILAYLFWIKAVKRVSVRVQLAADWAVLTGSLSAIICLK
jgi:glycosyltransferase involved in cell wall biosynthesis